ncbi:MAG: bifunctional phosphopantothenoylcysteine decarboxylase/phosphopantothenate--cysteine ligase CoaBC [Candidatus Neomarinimicrobiota bacterium]
MSVLKAKRILLGVTGSIAAYKACEIIRLLRKAGADVQVMLTYSGSKMVGPSTFAALSGKEVLMDLFPDTPKAGLEHIHLAETLDALVVAPATANIIAKMAQGVADDLLSTTALVCEVPTLIAPAMNFRMWRNEATQGNVELLRKRGLTVMEPEHGLLASLATGEGRMVEPEAVVSVLRDLLGTPQDLAGQRVLVTAGPTREPIDPVRFISNRSSGRMGYALAQAAVDRGASVTLVSGPTHIEVPSGCDVIRVNTADEMNQTVRKEAPDQDLIIMAAAVSDFRTTEPKDSKMKKQELPGTLKIKSTPDILKGLRDITRATIVGFALETGNGEENAREKMKMKRLDAIVLNYVDRPGSGFETPTNEGILFLGGRKKRTVLPLESKSDMAHRILSAVGKILATDKMKIE